MPTKEKKFEQIFKEAVEAGLKAGQEIAPEPMRLIDEFSGQRYTVNEGVCGFAWVIIKPGNSPFANWLKKNNHARRDNYYGGVSYWVTNFGQSYERKYAYAEAFADVLKKYDIYAIPMGQLD